jgi:HAD superfamily hydrolase (TIGR01509 family)
VTLYEAILLDLDGVIADTEPLKGEAHARTIDAFGGHGNSSLYGDFLGRPFDEVRQAFERSAGILSNPDGYRAEYLLRYNQLLAQHLKPIPGALEFITFAHKSHQLAIVTSSNREMAQDIVDRLNIDDKIEVIIAAQDVRNEKPDPEPYRVAARALGVSTKKALVFEDSLPGLLSAKRAGCAVVGVRHSLNRNQDLSSSIMVVENLYIDNRIRGLLRVDLEGHA